ncbi:anti-sigma factor [Cellulomonas aerilata]|uniref:Putative zinc-finger domain-containing protein n=1 Tax=Cellulomonas aerilata TaxID=515326 RepID=A0A512DE23_9CELL|nr:anti-sigma factor [Cellulomonas aerilata]GEO34723.1 hypothetical protein CAE01nite_24480 [Cellulomonas aerilata]
MSHHLGSLISALVDGQLSPADAERALAHVAACSPCADELAAARQARRALSAADDVAPAPELTARLLALGSCHDLGTPGVAGVAAGMAAGRDRRRPVVPLGESAFAVPAKALSGDLVRRRRFDPRAVIGVVTGAGVVMTALLLLGEEPRVAPSTHRADALTALSRAPQEWAVGSGSAERQIHATLAAVAPLGAGSDPAAVQRLTDSAVLDWVRGEGWTGPDRLPDGYVVTDVRITGDDAEMLEVDLAGPDGRVVLTEQHGWLDVTSLGPVEERTIDGRTLYVVSRHPWHAVWQADDTVVSIVSEAPEDRVADVVDAFPVAGYDDGIPARLTRGWDTVTGALVNP